MSDLFPIVGIITAIIIVLGIVVLYIAIKKKKDGKYVEPDYRAFFVFGICFIPISIVFMIAVTPAFIGFFGLGVIYTIIGLSHRDKWKKT